MTRLSIRALQHTDVLPIATTTRMTQTDSLYKKSTNLTTMTHFEDLSPEFTALATRIS